jgi:hypothetical protein
MADIAFRFSLALQSERFKAVHWFYWWAEPTLPGKIQSNRDVFLGQIIRIPVTGKRFMARNRQA